MQHSCFNCAQRTQVGGGVVLQLAAKPLPTNLMLCAFHTLFQRFSPIFCNPIDWNGRLSFFSSKARKKGQSAVSVFCIEKQTQTFKQQMKGAHYQFIKELFMFKIFIFYWLFNAKKQVVNLSIFADFQNFSTKFHLKKPFRFRKFFARKLICKIFQFSLIFNFLLTNSVFKNLFVSANFLPENWFAELSSFHWFSFFYLQIPFLKTFSFP